MKYLVIGAGGQLGKQWVSELESLDVEFTALNRKALDISDRSAIRKVLEQEKPQVLVNCAAYTKVDQAEDEPEKAELINGVAPGVIADICAQKNIKLIHYSTDYVFRGSEEDEQKYPTGYPEDAPTDPVNEYGKSKLMGESAIVNSGADHLIIRVSWLCGEFGNNFVKTMLRLGSERDELSVVNDQVGCPAFTKPVVNNTLQLIRSSKQGIFHLRSAGRITWFDLASAIFKEKYINVSLNAVSSEAFPSKAKRPNFSLLGIEKAKAVEGVIINDWKSDLSEMLNNLSE
ncbi:dTDP-4-dehydrorhamnose reductase [Balneola sp. MJW-20]|uniref:dTDP-4-dehydrorhamnose reductase n=1 Tax=Gracilimonas aurantiaca TaxID=3234185 RepID=UPI003466CA94